MTSVKITSNRIIYLTEKPSSNAFRKYGKATDTSKTDPLNTSVGYDINSVIPELEERRAKLLDLVRMAETRAREAVEEYEQFKAGQIQETNQRLVTEQKLRELKEDSLRPLGEEACTHEDAESNSILVSPVIGNGRDEQKTRRKVEEWGAVIELKKWKKEGELGGAEERRRQQENGPNNFILYATAITLLVGACLLLIAAFL